MFISRKDKEWLEDKVDSQNDRIYNLREQVSILANYLGLEFIEEKNGFTSNYVGISKKTKKILPFHLKGEK
jgi:hypothetical protein